jgi:phenylpropionate dioxygenase-like ring-hydroxylating dioxygenase large terminal subunit
MEPNRALEPSVEGCRDSVLLNDWHVVAASTDIVSGELVPVTLLERELVAWRDDEGQVHVWDDHCLHRGARLSKGFIQDNRVVCPYHGWNYDGSAQCVSMPAAPHETPMKKARAVDHHVSEKYGLVWVCLGTPERDVAPFPEWDDDSYKKVYCGPYAFKSGFRAVENFVDATHFPFVHAGLNGIRDNPDPIPPYEVYETDEGLETSVIRVTQPFGDPRNIPVIADYKYKCLRPLVAYFKKHVMIADPELASRGSPDDHFSILFAAQPVGETDSIVRIVCAMNFEPMPTDEQVRRRQEVIFAQDAEIVAMQRPARIPLDLRHELHHRTDLMGQKYRSWMRNMGVTYGTY